VQDAYAWALHAAGRSAEALPVARASARLGLRSPSFAYHLGAVEAAAGDPAAARQALRRALDLNPTFSPLHAPRASALLDRLGG
jgi:Flp pilus assembly protein TadD